jgi:acetyltransferase-like isoleucine patch superfamily enzyme
MSKMLYKVFKDSLNKIRKAYILRKYNDFNIAEYFRKQGAIVGENNRIMIRSLGGDPFLIKIGSHCSISLNVCFVTHDGGGWVFTEEMPSLQRFGKIEIKDNCYIGINCIILPNVIIGPNSIVGAGSVITKDVPPNAVVGGNPAKFIKTIEQYKKEMLDEWNEQKPPSYFEGENGYSRYSSEQIQKLKDKDRSLLVAHLKRIFNK